MKKFYSFVFAAVALVGFAACNSDSVDEAAPVQKGETVTFVANIDTTRTDLDGLQTIWDNDDTIVVKWNENDYHFTNKGQANANTFSCTAEGLSGIVGQPVTATYSNNNDGKVDSNAGTAGAVLTAEGNFGELSFTIQSAFFKFNYTGELTLKAGENENIFKTKDNEAANEITLNAKGETFVAFYPTGEETTISYSIDGVKCKETTKTFEAAKVYNLGTLVEPVVSGYNVVGSFQGWDVAAAKAVKMYTFGDDWAIARGVELYKSDEFKIVKGNTWDTSYGFKSVDVMPVNEEVTLDGTQNIRAAKNGKFDIYFNTTTTAAKYVCVEEYTDLMVNITIDNKANWNPLYITLKNGENIVVDNATVTNNTYAVSGDYIGESLSYVLSNGTKTLEGNVTISKDGATINLEETIITLTFVADTDNTKQWFSNAHIHVWGTGTAIDSPGWPGIAMTDNGDDTWSINVPSELVGKTINYVVNNGGDWKSNDSTVTIEAEGNTINLSSIGIN